MTTVFKDYGLNSVYIFWRALIEGFLWRALLEITFVEPFSSAIFYFGHHTDLCCKSYKPKCFANALKIAHMYFFWRAIFEGFIWRALLEITFVEPFLVVASKGQIKG